MSIYQASKVDSKKKKKSSSASVKIKKSSTSSMGGSIDINESSVIKQLRRDKEREQLMRLKANQKLALLEKLFSAKLKAMNVKLDDITDVKFDELQKRLQQTEATEGKMTDELQRLQRENVYLKKKQKAMTRTSPMSKKTLKLVRNKIDEKSRNILTANESQELFEGAILDYSRKQKAYQQRWCKLTNDGELLLFKNTKNTKTAMRTFDLITVFTEINKSRDAEFELISTLPTKEIRKFRTETEEDTDEWIKYVKIVQYYFKVKSQQNANNDENEHEYESENEANVEQKQKTFEAEKIKIKEKKKVKETDPFWLDISCKMDAMSYGYIKQVIPAKEQMDATDKKNNKWKETLWRTEYGEFELSCSVQLVCYDTGKWNDDENNILFGSISKYGVNSLSSWEKIADNLNREVKDVMKQYSKLVNISVKQLKKMARARG